jgi:5-formyltetrahydrofolate cyclo-ligase
MQKKEARKKFLKLRSLLSNNEILYKSEQIFLAWKKSILSEYDSYHIYLTISDKNEVDTSLILNYLWMNQKKVYCSKVNNNSLLHYELTPDTILKKNQWGIPEPIDQKNIFIQNIDCIFTPLLAYDILGNRVGYGKGYYDNFLKNYNFSTKVGLSFFDPIETIDDISSSDIPLDYIITPTYYSGFPIEVK